MIEWYDLDEYLSQLKLNGYNCFKETVTTQADKETIDVSELIGEETCAEYCIGVVSAYDANVLVNKIPEGRGMFVVRNTTNSKINVTFTVSDVEYNLVNCQNDIFVSNSMFSIEVLPLGARQVEFFVVDGMLNVDASQVHLNINQENSGNEGSGNEGGSGSGSGQQEEPANVNYLRFTSTFNQTVYVVSNMDDAPYFEYSTDGTTWNEWEHTVTSSGHTYSEKSVYNTTLYVRGVNTALSDCANNKYTTFKINGGSSTNTCKVGGNIQTLVDRYGVSDTAIQMARLFYVVYDLYTQTDLKIRIDSSDKLLLPAVNLVPYCYKEMFCRAGIYGVNSCYPSLPAKIAQPHCYESMFASCRFNNWGDAEIKLKIAADYCCADMFCDSDVSEVPDMYFYSTAPYSFARMFMSCHDISDISDGIVSSMSVIKTLHDYCYAEMFSNSNVNYTHNDINLSNVGYIGEGCCLMMFCSCYKLTHFVIERFPEPVTINGTKTYPFNSFAQMYQNTSTDYQYVTNLEHIVEDHFCYGPYNYTFDDEYIETNWNTSNEYYAFGYNYSQQDDEKTITDENTFMEYLGLRISQGSGGEYEE